MAKYYGMIGFAETVEIEPGDYEEQITERECYGDEIIVTRKLQNTEGSTNQSPMISNKLSVVADPYAVGHIFAMRYATYQGAKWTISDVEVQHPRLILSLGGLYNG